MQDVLPKLRVNFNQTTRCKPPEKSVVHSHWVGTSNLIYLWLYSSFVGSWPITVAAGSKTWSVFAPWNAGFVGLNPTRGTDICVRLFCVCAVLCVGSGLATGWSLVRGALLTLYRIMKLKKTARAQQRSVEPLLNE
jgi:hypothetical protein